MSGLKRSGETFRPTVKTWRSGRSCNRSRYPRFQSIARILMPRAMMPSMRMNVRFVLPDPLRPQIRRCSLSLLLPMVNG